MAAENTVQITEGAAHVLNLLHSASQELRRAASGVAAEANKVMTSQGVVAYNEHNANALLVAVSKVNAYVEAAQALAPVQAISVARRGQQGVYFSAGMTFPAEA